MEFTFSENKVVENLEKVPADLRGLYAAGDGEQEGKHVLKSDEVAQSAIKIITGLQTSLKASRAESKANKSQKVDLTALAEFGESPEAIAVNFREKLEEAQKLAKTSGNEEMTRQLEKIKQDLATVHSKESEKWGNRNTALQNQLYQTMVRASAFAEMEKQGVKDSELFFTLLQNDVKAGEDDTGYQVRIVDAQGDVRFSGVSGKEMTVSERIAEMKGEDRYSPFFKSEAPTGGGAQPGSTTRTPPAGKATLNPTEKIAVGLKKGQHIRT